MMQLSAHARLALPSALLGVAILMNLRSLTVHSFTHDSFLAQVVSESFAITMLWALLAWARQPAVWHMAVFGISAAAAFLTWPMWVGPLLVALGLTLIASSLPLRSRIEHALVAGTPLLVVAVLHTVGRLGAAAIVGTSGAVAPALPPLAWAVVILTPIGAAFAFRRATIRPLAWVVAALALQTGALWFVARANAAATPYMAIKMSYLGVYVAAAAAVVAVATMTRRALVLWTLAVLLCVTAVRDAQHDQPNAPVVDAELYEAGVWVRSRVPPHCVDYLVRNEYTAYWLHLAVLGNARLSARSRDDSVYLTEPSFARWIEGARHPRFAIARRSVLPAEIRDRTRVVYQAGDAQVIESLTPTSADVDDTCGGSPR
jgi:hypothetical protein